MINSFQYHCVLSLDYSKYAMKQFSTADIIKPIPNTVFAKAMPHGVNPAIGQFELGLEETNVLTPQTVIKQTQRLVNYQLDVDDPQQMLTAIQELVSCCNIAKL